MLVLDAFAAKRVDHFIDASGDRVVSRVISDDHLMVDLAPAKARRYSRQETTIEWLTRS